MASLLGENDYGVERYFKAALAFLDAYGGSTAELDLIQQWSAEEGSLELTPGQ